MTSIIRVTPLSGGGDHSPHCHLLEVDGFNFLLDCGWDENFNMDFIKELKKYVNKIDAVLISYPDCLHLGALPYAVGKLGLSCPIYATVPVHKMGQMFLYDIYQARHNIEDFLLFSLDEVDLAFEKITQLKYNQSVSLKGKGQGLTITPVPAGHMIGGTIWRIVKDGEEDIVYAVDFNHKKERHLNGCDIDQLPRPSLLITDAFNATYNQPKRRLRDEQLMTNILSTLRNSGNVLVCVDTAGRVLELAHMVDQLWSNKDSGLLAYSLALLNNVSYNVVEFAKSQIEWMSEKLMKLMGEKKANPFQFRHLKLCHSMAEVNKVPAPKVVLASMPDLECGFARELFMAWCSNPKHSVILTSRCGINTLGADLIANGGGGRMLSLEVRRRVKLTGAELDEFRARERDQNKKYHSSLVKEALDESSDSDEEMEPVSTRPGEKVPAKAVKHDILMKPDHKKQTGFFKSNKSKYPMYPFHEEKIKSDDYGEIIRMEDFMDTSESTTASAAQDGEAAAAEGDDSEDNQEVTEVPTKCVSTWQNFQVHANIQFIDFEGRTDGESIYKLLTGLRPRRVVLVRGNDSSLAAMASFCRDLVGGEKGAGDKVYTPRVGQVVDVTTERFIYQVRLRDSLFSKLSFSQARSGQISWIDARIKLSEDIPDLKQPEEEASKEAEPAAALGETLPGLDGVSVETTKKSLIPMLEPLDEDEEKSAGHATSFVNELKLSDFKLVLTRNGIPSEFQQGNLTCGQNSNVLLRRHESGRVMLEGCLTNDYYVIRNLLYQQYAIV